MKANYLIRLSIVIACTGIFFACNKNNNNAPDTTETGQTESNDEAQSSNEVDALATDANTALSSQTSISGYSSNSSRNGGTTTYGSGDVKTLGGGVTNLICDATVTFDTLNATKTITITYNGTNCAGNRTRTGVVTISIPAGVHWRDAGAVATIHINNFTITRKSDNKSIVLNGTKTITNVTGGLLIDLATAGTITHTISADDLSITFDDGSQRTWHIAKQRTFTYDNGIVITTTGTHTEGNDQGIAEWGTNRFGKSFESIINAPKVIRQDCDFRLVSGQNIIKKGTDTLTVTYGLDATGNPTSCPGTGFYYFKAVWVGKNGKTFTIIYPY